MQYTHTLIKRNVFAPPRQPRIFRRQILLFIAISLLNYTLLLDLLCLYIYTAFEGVQFIFIIPVLVVLWIFLVSCE